MGIANDHNPSDAQTRQTQRLESLGELASGIAHEINTPAQYVGDNVRFLQSEFANLLKLIDRLREMLDNPSSDAETRRQLIESVERELDFEFLRVEIPQAISQSLEGLERVTTIVRAMKEFSHPGTTVMEPVDLRKLITSTLEVCRNRWKYVADVATDFAADLPVVPCLPAEMNQVILNLVVNAADAIAERYGKDGTHRGVITMRLKQDGDQVEMRVEDDGTGISPSAREHLFEQFFTTKGVGKGTGQGLAFCRNVIVSKHTGTIDVQSTPGAGTSFIIRLPLQQSGYQDAGPEGT